MIDTLRDRLHEHLHVSDPDTWTCEGVTEDCSMFPAVIHPLEQLVTEWLRDKSDWWDGQSLRHLAEFAERGKA